ncbi:MAG: PASTA domain-containing protein [Pyrinomonadaceae bacterium]
MSFAKQSLAALGKIGIVLAIGIAFLSGLAGTVYLSLRSAEVRVPEIVGKDRMAAESALTDAGLRMRQRATRYSAEAQPNTILDQSPKPGEIIKVGQTVAVVLSRAAAKEGETSTPPATAEGKTETDKSKENQNANTQASANNKNENQNQNKEKRNRNTNNKNANNSNNSNNSNNANANNRNAKNTNNRNVNTNRNANANSGNANTNSSPGANNSNTNKRPPVNISTPPFNPTGTSP